MRKLFTFAAAVLASVAMNASTVTFTLADIFDGNSTSAEVTTPAKATISTNGSKSNAKESKISNDGNYFQVLLAEDTFSAASFNGYINSNDQTKNWAFQFSTDGGTNWTEEVNQASDGIKEGHDINIEATIPDGANGIRIIRRSGTTAYVYAISLELGAPSTDPVAEVTINGPATCYVGETVTYTISTDVKATEYQWVVGVVQEGETGNKFSFKPQSIGSYEIMGQARNGYNETDTWISSNVISLVVSERPAAVACAELYPAASGDAPAQGAKAALKDESFGGNIIFVGAKEGKYTESFQYNEYGLQMCKGGADSVRVELGFNLKVGSIIELQINQNGLEGNKARGFKLLAPGQSTVLTATWQQADELDLDSVFIYEVKEGDKLAGQNKFGIVRSESAILHAVIVSDCGEELIPSTDPVTSIVVDGPAKGYAGQPATFKATFDVEPDEIYWTVAGSVQAGATTSTFTFTPPSAGTYRIAAWARNEYNGENWVSSEEFSLEVEELLEQVSVSEPIVWNWENAASSEIKFDNNTTPKKNERFLLANVGGMNNDENFNSQALLFEGEYAYRVQGSFKLCQGQLLQFNTTVPGYVSVEYSNTGNRETKEGEAEGQESLRRFLSINDALVDSDPGSMRSDTKTFVVNIPVEAGDVAIGGRMPYRTDGKDAATAEYIRIYKVVFSIEEIIPEGLEEIDATAKAVKVIYNGQLLIKKGDVYYNAQGAIVK